MFEPPRRRRGKFDKATFVLVVQVQIFTTLSKDEEFGTTVIAKQEDLCHFSHYLAAYLRMKLLTLLFVVLLGACVCVTTSQASSPSATRLLQNEFEDDEPWPNGTPVYYEYQGAWYEGSITKYFDGVYTITWVEDGEVEYFDDVTIVDKMVTAAQNRDDSNAYDVGTIVYRYFATEKKFHHGEIVEYKDGNYRVEWSNGVVEEYPPGAGIDALVLAAEESTPVPETAAATQAAVFAATVAPTAADTPADTDADTETLSPTEDATLEETSVPLEIGTEVYKFFPEDGWFWGTISWYKDGVYTITWEDNSKEKYDDIVEVTAMAERASKQNDGDEQESDPWENGTAVFKTFSEGDFFGEIINYQKGKYTVRWSDDTLATYTIAQTDAMVQAAYAKVEEAKASQTTQAAKTTKNDKKPLEPGAIFLICVLAISAVAILALAIRRHRTGKEKDSLEKHPNLAPTHYKDEPDAGEPIPDVI